MKEGRRERAALPAACESLSPPLVSAGLSASPSSRPFCAELGSCSPRGRRQRSVLLLLPSGPHGFGRQRHGGGARLGADPAEARGAGVHLPGAMPGPRSRAEPRLGDGGPPVLPVPLGVLPQARQLGQLALRVDAAQRWDTALPGPASPTPPRLRSPPPAAPRPRSSPLPGPCPVPSSALSAFPPNLGCLLLSRPHPVHWDLPYLPRALSDPPASPESPLLHPCLLPGASLPERGSAWVSPWCPSGLSASPPAAPAPRLAPCSGRRRREKSPAPLSSRPPRPSRSRASSSIPNLLPASPVLALAIPGLRGPDPASPWLSGVGVEAAAVSVSSVLEGEHWESVLGSSVCLRGGLGCRRDGRLASVSERGDWFPICLGLCFHKRSRVWTSLIIFLCSSCSRTARSFWGSSILLSVIPTPSPEVTNLGKLGLPKSKPIVILSRVRTPGLGLALHPP